MLRRVLAFLLPVAPPQVGRRSPHCSALTLPPIQPRRALRSRLPPPHNTPLQDEHHGDLQRHPQQAQPPSPSKLPLATCSLSPTAFPSPPSSLEAALAALEAQHPASPSPRSPAASAGAASAANWAQQLVRETAAACAVGQHRRRLTPEQERRERRRLRQQQDDHMQTLHRLEIALQRERERFGRIAGGDTTTAGHSLRVATAGALGEQPPGHVSQPAPARAAPLPSPQQQHFTLVPVFQTAVAGGTATQLVPLHCARQQQAPQPEAAAAAAGPAALLPSTSSFPSMHSATSWPDELGAEGSPNRCITPSRQQQLGRGRSTAVTEEAVADAQPTASFISFIVGVQGLQEEPGSDGRSHGRSSPLDGAEASPSPATTLAASSPGQSEEEGEQALPASDSQAALLGEGDSAGCSIAAFHITSAAGGSGGAAQPHAPLLAQWRQALHSRLQARPKPLQRQERRGGAVADTAVDVAPKRRGGRACASADENDPTPMC